VNDSSPYDAAAQLDRQQEMGGYSTTKQIRESAADRR
jgi:hypothetical protein